jgi:GMP synthase (glutamine-hydrolysing)
MGLRLLVVEGNTRQARELHESISGKMPGRAYADTLMSLAPDAVCDICFPADDGANLPDGMGIEGYDGVVLTGSSLNIYDGSPAVARQLDLARTIYAARTPFLGSCWGLQIASAAAGGDVKKNPLGRETGIARNIALTDAGRNHPLLVGRPAAFDAPCSHDDIVAVPPADATILATNAMAPIQAAEIRHDGGTFWGFQYHPEFTLSEVAAILQRAADHLVRVGLFGSPEENRAYCADLRALDADPARRDIAWRLGIQPEVVDRHVRLTEIRNWLDQRVRPEMSRRGRA